MDCRSSSSGSSSDLRRLRPRVPQRRAAGGDRGRAPARVRQQRADPVAAAADGAQRLPRRARRSTDLDRLAPYDTALAEELADQLQEHADQQSYVFPGPVTIGFESADDLTTGRFRVRSRAQAKVTGNATHTQVRRARALLEVNGTRHPLQAPGLVVGRGTEADLRINDPGVSRRHVEFVVDRAAAAAATSALSVQDLGSTNGMLVDGHRITSTGLRDGSTVKIGHTTMTVGSSRRTSGCLS